VGLAIGRQHLTHDQQVGGTTDWVRHHTHRPAERDEVTIIIKLGPVTAFETSDSSSEVCKHICKASQKTC
jgi:hypothetical protein